jgi:hypothetical protein
MKHQSHYIRKLAALCAGFWVFASYAAVSFLLFIARLCSTGAPYRTEGLLA